MLRICTGFNKNVFETFKHIKNVIYNTKNEYVLQISTHIFQSLNN